MGTRIVRINKEMIGHAIKDILNPFTIYHDFEAPKDIKFIKMEEDTGKKGCIDFYFQSEKLSGESYWTFKINKNFEEIPKITLGLLKVDKKEK